jgi:hypothetical protein
MDAARVVRCAFAWAVRVLDCDLGTRDPAAGTRRERDSKARSSPTIVRNGSPTVIER